MNSPAAVSEDEPSPRAILRSVPWLITLVGLVGGAVTLRAWLLFRSAIPPGMDAGYYPFQTRTLLEHGRLAYDDVPARFAFDAVLARAAAALTGWSIDDAALWASRVVDSIVQPFVAAAIVLVAFVWSRGRSAAIPAAIGAALFATVSRPIIDMTGDFEKQSMALCWTAFAWMLTWRGLGASRRRDAVRSLVGAAILLVLTGATHVGTFGGAVVGCCAMLITWASLGGVSRRRAAAIGGVIALACALALLGMWSIAPDKTVALLKAPLLLVGGSETRGTRGLPWRAAILALAATIVVGIVATLIAHLALHRAGCRTGHDAPVTPRSRANGALVVAMIATGAILTCPLLPGEYAMRVGLIAITPAALTLLFFLVAPSNAGLEDSPARWRRRAERALRAIGPAALILGSLASAPASRVFGPHQMISAGGLAELRAWREELGTSLRDIVVARHGLEWWAGFAMHSAVRVHQLKASDVGKYERLFILRELRPTGPERDRDRGPPPDSDHRRPPGGAGGPDGMMSLGPIPSTARVIRRGEWFTLYEMPKDAAVEPSGEPTS